MIYVIESVVGDHVDINPNGFDRIARVHPVTDYAAAVTLAAQLFASTKDDESLVRHTLEELFLISNDSYCVQIVDTESEFDREEYKNDEEEVEEEVG